MVLRGAALVSLLAAVESEFGSAGLARIREALAPEIRALISAPIEMTASFPVTVSAAVHEAIRTELGDGGLAMNRHLGSLAARADFGGSHSAFISKGNFEALLMATERAWQRYNSHGRVEWPVIETGHAVATIRYVSEYTEAMWEAIAGRLMSVLELGGATNVSITILEWTHESVRYELRWSE